MAHLIVLVHGLHGFSSDMTYLGSQITSRAISLGVSDSTFVLSPECNHAKTLDSLETQAHRITTDIKTWIESHPTTLIHLSLIGHSLGGMIARCIASQVARELPTLQFHHFITIATPHLGSKYLSLLSPLTPSSAIIYIAGQAGRELFLLDDPTSPLLLQMATQPSYTSPLAAFDTRTVYANVSHDTSVGFETAAIRADNPCFWTLDTFTTPLYGFLNSIPYLNHREATQPRVEDISGIQAVDPVSGSDPDGIVKRMLDGLNGMVWTRVVVFPTRGLLAHVDCIVKSEVFNKQFGDTVIQDVVRRLFVQEGVSGIEINGRN
ncbi:hypothetical protein HDU98_006844 [Podochytrium sp. JEL0797]|nr:hypothetical protein HDU98_006844 [Podochytrium sp. JEL0797]